jgi:hypothetical protein
MVIGEDFLGPNKSLVMPALFKAILGVTSLK